MQVLVKCNKPAFVQALRAKMDDTWNGTSIKSGFGFYYCLDIAALFTGILKTSREQNIIWTSTKRMPGSFSIK